MQKTETLFVVVSFSISFIFLAAGILLKNPSTLNYSTLLGLRIMKAVVFGIGFLFLILGLHGVMTKKTSLIKKFLMSFFVIVLCFLLLEGMLQAFSGVFVQTENFGQSDALLHHSLIPNSYVEARFWGALDEKWTYEVNINSDGLRNEEIGEKDKFRILLLGDSFTFGYGADLDQTFSKVLEKKFNGKVEVINAGVGSYSPIIEYLYLREKGMGFEPDMVILNLDMSDLQDDNIYENAAIFEGEYLVAVPGEKSDVVGVVEEHQRGGVVGLYQKLKTLQMLKGTIDGFYARNPNKMVSKQDYLGNIQYDRYAATRLVNQSTLGEHWGRTFRYIEKTKDLCDENGIKFVLTVYPLGHQVSDDEWADGRYIYSFELGKTYPITAGETVEDFGRGKNITVVNMMPSFRSNNKRQLFFPRDGHFSVEGNELAAELIYEEIKDSI